MFKHIFGQALLQLTVMLLLTFLTDQFLPEYADDFDTLLGPDNLGCKYNG